MRAWSAPTPGSTISRCCRARPTMPSSWRCSSTTRPTRSCIRRCRFTCGIGGRSWPCGVRTIPSSDPPGPAPSPRTCPTPKSICSTVATSCSKARAPRSSSCSATSSAAGSWLIAEGSGQGDWHGSKGLWPPSGPGGSWWRSRYPSDCCSRSRCVGACGCVSAGSGRLGSDLMPKRRFHGMGWPAGWAVGASARAHISRIATAIRIRPKAGRGASTSPP